jgi:hypothetical protein
LLRLLLRVYLILMVGESGLEILNPMKMTA